MIIFIDCAIKNHQKELFQYDLELVATWLFVKLYK